MFCYVLMTVLGRDVWSRGREHITKPLNNPHNNNNNNTSLGAWVGLLTPL